MTEYTIKRIVVSIICLLVFTLACQLPAAVSLPSFERATETPQPTLTPSLTPTKTPTPTRVPTLTPTPFPSLEDVAIFKEDLPKGFNVRPLDVDEKWGDLKIGEAFRFRGDQTFTDLIGWTLVLPDRESQRSFDVLINQPNLLADLYADKEGAEYKLLPDMEGLGEYSIGFTLLVGDRHDRQLDVGLLRRGPVGLLLLVEYPAGRIPVVKVHDLALLMDQRIQETVPANE